MRVSFLLLLLLALVNPSVHQSFHSPAQSLHFQYKSPLSDRQLAFILANATVNWYNNKTNSHIVLFNVTDGTEQFFFDRLHEPVPGQPDKIRDELTKVHYILHMDVLVPKPNCTSSELKHYWGSVIDYSKVQNRTGFEFLSAGERGTCFSCR